MADLNESLKIKSEILKQYLPFENNFKKIQKKIQNVKTYSLSRISIDYLSEIVNAIPNGTVLSNINYMDNSVSFSAILPSKEIMKQMIANFNSLKFVKKISIPSVSKKSGNDQEIKVDFILDVA